MLRAGHSVPDRITQVGEIVFGRGRKWYGPMAKAIGIPTCELDSYMFHRWEPEGEDQLNLFLADLLMRYAHAEMPPRDQVRHDDIENLAAQYRAPRHRPFIPTPDTDEFILHSTTDYELDMPPGAREMIEKLLKDD